MLGPGRQRWPCVTAVESKAVPKGSISVKCQGMLVLQPQSQIPNELHLRPKTVQLIWIALNTMQITQEVPREAVLLVASCCVKTLVNVFPCQGERQVAQKKRTLLFPALRNALKTLF